MRSPLTTGEQQRFARHRTGLVGGLVLAGVLVCLVTPASAQGRPFVGLFGGNQGRSTGKQSLTVSASVYGGFDTNSLENLGSGVDDASDTADPRLQPSYTYTGLDASLQYSRPGRISLGASGGTALQYLTDQRDLIPLSHYAGVGVGGRLGRRTSFNANQGVSYSPYYLFGNFPTLISPGLGDLGIHAFDYSVNRRPAYTYDTSLDLSQTLSTRSTLSFGYSLAYTDFVDEDTNFPAQTVSATFTRSLTKNTALRFGYAYGEAQYGLGEEEPVRTHGIDIGVDYNRQLSLTRRTSLSFGFGSTVIQNAGSPGIQDDGHTQYGLVGNAILNHQIGRSWTASLVYDRGVNFVAGFREPFFSDSVIGSVDGLLSRRVHFQGSTAYSAGELGFSQTAGTKSYIATAGLDFAFARSLAAYAQYVYFAYQFDEGAALPDAFPSGLDRQSVHVGLSLWLSLLR